MSTSSVPSVSVCPWPHRCSPVFALAPEWAPRRGVCFLCYLVIPMLQHRDLQGFGDHCQLGEVRPPAVYSCPVSLDAGRHVSQRGVPVGSSSGCFLAAATFLLLLSSPPAHMAAVVGPHGFTGAFFSSGLLTHASFVAVTSRITGPTWWMTLLFRFLCCRSEWKRFVGGSRRISGCSVSHSRFLLRLLLHTSVHLSG